MSYSALWLLQYHILGVLRCTVASRRSHVRCLTVHCGFCNFIANNRHFCFLVLKAGSGRSKRQQFPFCRGPAFWIWFISDTFLAFLELLWCNLGEERIHLGSTSRPQPIVESGQVLKQELGAGTVEESGLGAHPLLLSLAHAQLTLLQSPGSGFACNGLGLSTSINNQDIPSQSCP